MQSMRPGVLTQGCSQRPWHQMSSLPAVLVAHCASYSSDCEALATKDNFLKYIFYKLKYIIEALLEDE